MPSKKKSSRTPSKVSNSDWNSDFPSSPASVSSSVEPGHEELLLSLEEASAKFPSLISPTDFVGKVVDGVISDSRGCKVWLSESSMVSSSIPPGSLISVSLSSLDKVPSSFPLSALPDECARHFGFELLGHNSNEAGEFFALATVFPSPKVLKNGVRLSLNLSYTMGCPASGRTIFVHPIKYQPSTENGNGNQCALTDSCISLECCKELYLSPVCLKDKIKTKGEADNGHIQVSKNLSPMTPSLSESQLSSPCSTQSHTSRYDKSTLKSTHNFHASIDMVNLEEILGDDSSRKLLETCILTWLSSRSFLFRNFIVVPILSGLCVLQVVGSKRLFSNSETCNGMNDFPAQDPNVVKDRVSALSVDWGTKLHLLLRGNPAVETVVEDPLAHPVYDESGMIINLAKLGGLSKEFAALRDIIVSSNLQAAVSSLGLRPTKGVLLHGPPGTGKTTLAHACAQDAGVKMFSVNGPGIISQYHGETEQALHEVFNKASQASPAIVFIDELDAIAPARKDGGDELSQRMVATLLNLMDGINRNDGILILAATNRVDSIEPALRRPGRLDREIEIGVPSPGQRHEILLALLSEMQHSLLDKDIQDLAMTTHGFVGADLAALCNEAAMVCLWQHVKSKGMGTETKLSVTSQDFGKARVRVRPSAMREVILEVPKVRWEDVGGQVEVKAQLMEAVLWPQKHRDAFERVGTRPPSGILLFGPPGCSKTLLARAVASEAGLNFLAVKGPELFSKWVGESEKAVRSLFAKARANAPSIIFFDEIDGLAVIRGRESDGVSVGDRVISQLLVELDGLQQRGRVTVIAATNRPDKIDPALLRPGRFDRLLYVGPPNQKDREDIFRVHLRRMPCSSDISISELSLLTEGCTGADISRICREAGLAALEENLSASEITMRHLKVGLQQLEPTDVQMYEKLLTKFQRFVHSTAEEDEFECEPCSSSPSHMPLWTRIRSTLSSLSWLPWFNSQSRSY